MWSLLLRVRHCCMYSPLIGGDSDYYYPLKSREVKKIRRQNQFTLSLVSDNECLVFQCLHVHACVHIHLQTCFCAILSLVYVGFVSLGHAAQ